MLQIKKKKKKKLFLRMFPPYNKIKTMTKCLMCKRLKFKKKNSSQVSVLSTSI